MSRFPGWTEKDILRLIGETKELRNKRGIQTPGQASNRRETARETRTQSNHKSCYVLMISGALDRLGIDHKLEYRFLYDRRFRFDIALPQFKIAVEFEGGIYSKGRHTRGKGYSNDAKKYNLAVMYNWKLLRFTTDDAKKKNWEFEIADKIKSLIELTKKKE